MSQGEKKVNYALRPAKNVERKMLAEAFKRLSILAPLENYRYVGFGSHFFSDFRLFHRWLGIGHMTSIEKKESKKERCEFNRPYKCIELILGHSNDVLPQLSWSNPVILWLDYTDSLNEEVFVDVTHFCRHARHASVIIISVNVHGLGSKDFLQKVGEHRIDKIGPQDLEGWGGAKLSRQIIINEIYDRLSERNGTLPRDQKLQFMQLFNFWYEDGAKMLTLGGMLYETEAENQMMQRAFQNLPFVSNGVEPYHIEVPNLTLREIRSLDIELPGGNLGKFVNMGISDSDLKKYEQIYRYFPRFTESEI